jgi:hypothetical protein
MYRRTQWDAMHFLRFWAGKRHFSLFTSNDAQHALLRFVITLRANGMECGAVHFVVNQSIASVATSGGTVWGPSNSR